MDVLRLRQMVEQIARNLAARGEDAAVAALAEHIVQFWDPRMRAALLADDRENLSSVARRAIELLAAQTATASRCREVDTPLP